MKASLKKPYILVLLAALILSLAAATVRSILLFFRFDAALGYFEEGALSELLFPLLIVIAAVLYVAFGFLSRAQLEEKERKNTVFLTFASAFAAVSTAVWTLTSLPRLFDDVATSMEKLFCALTLLSSVALILYFVLNALDTGSLALRTASAIGSVLFAVFYILYAYFDSELVLNSPVKILDQLCVLVFVLFFIAECRFFFGTAKNAIYLPITLLAFTLSFSSSVPELLYTLKAGESPAGNVMHGFMIFALSLYAAARLLAVLELEKKADSRGVYADEIKESTENDLHPDNDTHIVAYDLDQQSFDFDGESEEVEETAEEPTEEDGEEADDEENADSIDTTLTFERHE